MSWGDGVDPTGTRTSNVANFNNKYATSMARRASGAHRRRSQGSPLALENRGCAEGGNTVLNGQTYDRPSHGR